MRLVEIWNSPLRLLTHLLTPAEGLVCHALPDLCLPGWCKSFSCEWYRSHSGHQETTGATYKSTPRINQKPAAQPASWDLWALYFWNSLSVSSVSCCVPTIAPVTINVLRLDIGVYESWAAPRKKSYLLICYKSCKIGWTSGWTLRRISGRQANSDCRSPPDGLTDEVLTAELSLGSALICSQACWSTPVPISSLNYCERHRI